jgi:hypothetical protein
MPDEVAQRYSDEFSPDAGVIECHKKLEALKERLRKDPHVGSHVFDYSVGWDKTTNRICGLEAFGELVYQNLWAALDEETKDLVGQRPATWEEQERTSLAEFVDQRRRGFVGRTELLLRLRTIAYGVSVQATKQDKHAIFGACIVGSSGSGKSALFAELHRQFTADGSVVLLANTAGGTIRGSSVDAILRRWIEELARFLDIANPLSEHITSDGVDSLFHSLLNRASALRRVVLLLDALDQTEPTARSQYLTWLKAAPWHSNVRLLATALPCKAATVLSEASGIEQIELPPLTQADAEAIVRQVWRRYHREINFAVLGSLTQKTLDPSSQTVGNPLWLTLASEQLNLLDADDFHRAEEEFSGSPTERMQTLLLDTTRRMPADVSELYRWLYDRAAKSFGSGRLKALLAAVSLSRHGRRESDLQVLIPRLTTILENGAGTTLTNLVNDAAMKRAENRYDPQYTPSHSQDVLPAAELAAIRRAFRSSLILRNELQWDFFHREARTSARLYLGLLPEVEKAVHKVIAAFLIEQRNDDPVRCDEVTFHLLEAGEYGWVQIFYGSTHTTHERELASATATLVDEVNRGGMERLAKISNIDVAPQLVGEDGIGLGDLNDEFTCFKKDIRRDVAKGWCNRCMEELLPALASAAPVSARQSLI